MYYEAFTDKYGRKAQKLTDDDGFTLGVVVRLPKAYTERYGATHLTNDWSRADGAVQYHASLKDAKAALEARVQA